MNKSEFISLIEHPETLGKSHITALKHIAADFPYFQCAQTLLTKALYNEHHYEFEKHLKHTSLMVPDRAVLFRYIHNLKEVAEAYQQHPVEQYTQPTAIPEPVIEVLEKAHIPVEEQKTAEPETATPEPEIIEDPTTVIEEEITAIVEPPVEIIQEEPETLIEEPVVDTEEITPEPQTEEPTAEITIDSGEIHSFTEWLQLQQNKKIVVETKAEPEPVISPEQEVIAEKGETVAPVPETTGISQPEEPEPPKQSPKTNIGEFESILDKFIKDNPRISRPKAEFYNPVNMAKQSVEADEELVTETLANVYYKQGHYRKAIRAYEKLCLIYPHKMTYFASLIQKIKTENKE